MHIVAKMLQGLEASSLISTSNVNFTDKLEAIIFWVVQNLKVLDFTLHIPS